MSHHLHACETCNENADDHTGAPVGSPSVCLENESQDVAQRVDLSYLSRLVVVIELPGVRDVLTISCLLRVHAKCPD